MLEVEMTAKKQKQYIEYITGAAKEYKLDGYDMIVQDLEKLWVNKKC